MTGITMSVMTSVGSSAKAMPSASRPSPATLTAKPALLRSSRSCSAWVGLSSAIRILTWSGVILLGSSIAISPGLSMVIRARCGQQLLQGVGDGGRCQHMAGGVELYGGAGHAEDNGRVAILGDGHGAGLAQRPQLLRAVA